MASTVTAMPSTRMSEAEWQTRLDLAACYRLVDLFGWSDLVNTRITARVPGQHAHFLINPHGLLFDEVTASSLVKIDADGNKVEPSESEVNSGGFAMPSTIHMARPEVACVLHTPTTGVNFLLNIRTLGSPAREGGLRALSSHTLRAVFHATTRCRSQRGSRVSSPGSMPLSDRGNRPETSGALHLGYGPRANLSRVAR